MSPQIFSEAEAEHYCSSFAGFSTPAIRSLEEFIPSVFNQRQLRINEGSPLFDQYRDYALREAEALLFLAASHYRRALDLMFASSAPWAHVTLYYGAFYCAKALLLMFGCFVQKNHVIDVGDRIPGQQVLRRRRIGNSTNQIFSQYPNFSSHVKFWDFFYRATASLRTTIDARLEVCLQPSPSGPDWLSEERNQVNYRLAFAINAISNFQNSFDPMTFPNCLSGSLATQYSTFVLLLELTFSFAQKFKIKTDALDTLLPTTTVLQKIRQLIYDPVPVNLGGQPISAFLLPPPP